VRDRGALAAGQCGSAGEFARLLERRYDPHVGTELAIAAVVRGLFGAESEDQLPQPDPRRAACPEARPE